MSNSVNNQPDKKGSEYIPVDQSMHQPLVSSSPSGTRQPPSIYQQHSDLQSHEGSRQDDPPPGQYSVLSEDPPLGRYSVLSEDLPRVSVMPLPKEAQPPLQGQLQVNSPQAQHLAAQGANPYPVTVQPLPGAQQPPSQDNWMNLPMGPPSGCPPGLEYLTAIDQLLVHQKVEMFEAFTGFETQNKFIVKNSLGQQVFYAKEDSDCCARNCCGPLRPFGMKILDNFQREVIHLERPLACGSCCFPCCLQSLEVFAPPGCLVGTIEQEWSICIPLFTVKDAEGNAVLHIEGPICTCSFFGDVDFNVFSKNKDNIVGKISKQWSGLLREVFTDADNFGITFPMDLTVQMKAVMLGACFLIDMMYFEKQKNNDC